MQSLQRTNPDQTEKQRPMMTAAWWGLLLVPAALYLGIIVNYSSNLPLVDDYVAFLHQLRTAPDAEPIWLRLWAQHNEHRIVLPKLIAWMQWKLTGELNFRVLIMLGAFGWLVAAGILAWMLREVGRLTRWESLPIFWLLLLPVHEENMLWAMASLQNYWSLAIGFGCLLLLQKRRLMAGWFLLVLAVVTSGNGLVLVPVAIISLWWRGQSRWAVQTCGLGVLVLGLYFYQFHRVEYHTNPFSALLRPVETGAYALAFLGAVTGAVKPAVLLGGGVLAGLFVLLWRNRREPYAIEIALYLLGTTAIIALSRSGFGLEHAYSSRYRMYSVMILALVCVLAVRALPTFWRRAFLGTGGVGVVGYFIALCIGAMEPNRFLVMQASIRTEFNLVAGRYASHAYVSGFLDHAQQGGVYDGWAAWKRTTPLAPREWPEGRPMPSEPGKWGAHVDIYDGRYIQGWAALAKLASSESTIDLILKGETKTWIVPVQRFERPDINEVIKDGGDYRMAGFRMYLPAFAVPPGKYAIAMRVRQGELEQVIWPDLYYQGEVPLLDPN